MKKQKSLRKPKSKGVGKSHRQRMKDRRRRQRKNRLDIESKKLFRISIGIQDGNVGLFLERERPL